MKFVDQAVIYVKAGDGGRGCVSFRREKYVPRGGPDGGDGGRGAHVYLVASSQKDTLFRFHLNQHFRAENGRPGLGKNKHGRDGNDLYIELPVGTLVMNAESGRILFDLDQPGREFCVAAGGRGGRGNARFVTSTNRAPRHAQTGEPGDELRVRLELKLLADVGLVGFPNAGKSTLISRLSAARPKIADYPFTTLIPNLGVVAIDADHSYVMADVPGLIQGASQGAGLGHRFLKHIERCRVLLHLLDASQMDLQNPLENLHLIQKELDAFEPKLSQKKQIIAVNKIDIPDGDQYFERVKEALPDHHVLGISALTGQGLKEIKYALFQLVNQAKEAEAAEAQTAETENQD